MKKQLEIEALPPGLGQGQGPLSAEEIPAFMELVKRIERAEKPDQADLVALKKDLKRATTLYKEVSSLAGQVQKKIINAAAHSNIWKVGLQVRLDEIAENLNYEEASELERLLIEQIQNAWLFQSYLELLYQGAIEEGGSIELCDFWERRMNASQRRYLRTVEALARVRRLAVANLQINIGERQLNLVK